MRIFLMREEIEVDTLLTVGELNKGASFMVPLSKVSQFNESRIPCVVLFILPRRTT